MLMVNMKVAIRLLLLMGQIENAYKCLVEKPERRRTLGRLRRKWEEDII
jgi:hypothetical protein